LKQSSPVNPVRLSMSRCFTFVRARHSWRPWPWPQGIQLCPWPRILWPWLHLWS